MSDCIVYSSRVEGSILTGGKLFAEFVIEDSARIWQGV